MRRADVGQFRRAKDNARAELFQRQLYPWLSQPYLRTSTIHGVLVLNCPVTGAVRMLLAPVLSCDRIAQGANILVTFFFDCNWDLRKRDCVPFVRTHCTTHVLRAACPAGGLLPLLYRYRLHA